MSIAATTPLAPGQRQEDKGRGPGGIPGLVKTAWGLQDATQQYPRLEQDTNCDVVVAGGGLAGLSIAYNCAKLGGRRTHLL